MKFIVRILSIILISIYLANSTTIWHCEWQNEETIVQDFIVPVFRQNEEMYVFEKGKHNIWLYFRDMAFWKVPSSATYEFTTEKFSYLDEKIEKEREAKRKEKEQEKQKKKEIDEYELWLLAHLIYAEGGGEDFEFQIRVGNVVLNRVESEYFPNTLEKVIFQKGQYACTWLGGFYYEPSEISWEAARWLLEGNRVFPKNVVFQAEFPQGDGTYEFRVNTYFGYIDR